MEMIRCMAPIATCLLWTAINPLGAAPPTRMYTAENYDVSVRLDLAKQRLYGEVGIRLHNRTDSAISAVDLDAGALVISSVLEGQTPQSFDRDHSLLFVVLTKPLRPDEPRTITVRYEAGPSPGLKFFPDQAYTSNISDWMPCNDGPGERATLHLTIAAPPDTKSAGSGKLTATRASEGRSITEWQLDTPVEPSWFGFAVGAFAENTTDAEGVKLRVLGAGAQVFEPTAAALHYLAEHTGKHYPGPTYTQVFAHGDVSRAMAGGLALLPDSTAQELAKQPESLWLLTNELAHQWYGIGIAAKDWSDLWLSEGVSAFLASAFLGQRFGKETYEREIQRSRQIYNQLRAEGKDRALSDTGWTTRQEADGEIPEYKGASFLHLVNVLAGDTPFWNGLRLYTSDQWGHAAASEDIQKAFDAVDTGNATPAAKASASRRKKNSKNSPKPLDALFDLWVYGVPEASSKKKSR
jgi:aminopeptidase N